MMNTTKTAVFHSMMMKAAQQAKKRMLDLIRKKKHERN